MEFHRHDVYGILGWLLFLSIFNFDESSCTDCSNPQTGVVYVQFWTLYHVSWQSYQISSDRQELCLIHNDDIFKITIRVHRVYFLSCGIQIFITSNDRQTGVNVLGLLYRFSTLSVKCWTGNFCIHASRGPVIIMHQLKFLYNSPFKNSYSHPIHTCFPMIASNVDDKSITTYQFLTLWFTEIHGRLNMPPPRQPVDPSSPHPLWKTISDTSVFA